MARMKSPALRLPMRVWDLPVRLFHWSIVILVVVSYVSVSLVDIDYAWIQVHLVSGYTALTLLVVRIAWGFVGSDTARFGAFLGSPLAGLRHLRHFQTRAPDDQVGHNAAGGWMVLIMLVLLAAQAGTGLFAHDNHTTGGALAGTVDEATRHTVTIVHAVLFKVLAACITLHVAVVLAYALINRHDLIRPMFTGKKRLLATTPAPRMANPLLALGILLLAALGVALLALRA